MGAKREESEQQTTKIGGEQCDSEREQSEEQTEGRNTMHRKNAVECRGTHAERRGSDWRRVNVAVARKIEPTVEWSEQYSNSATRQRNAAVLSEQTNAMYGAARRDNTPHPAVLISCSLPTHSSTATHGLSCEVGYMSNLYHRLCFTIAAYNGISQPQSSQILLCGRACEPQWHLTVRVAA